MAIRATFQPAKLTLQVIALSKRRIAWARHDDDLALQVSSCEGSAGTNAATSCRNAW
jgi:hypothetical protein